MKSLFVALSVTLLLAGCEATMRADVTQFSALGGPPVGRNFAVIAEPAQSGSLEFQYYAGLVGAALQQHGFVAAPVGVAPELVVQIHYAGAGNHTEIYGDWGWGGWGWRHRGWGGGPPYDSVTLYGETLEVQILDGAAWRNNVHTMLYQGRAVGDTRIEDASSAIPALVQALFAHFPGNSGSIERVVVPVVEQKSPLLAPPPAGPKTAT
jgi:hypothetical protein